MKLTIWPTPRTLAITGKFTNRGFWFIPGDKLVKIQKLISKEQVPESSGNDITKPRQGTSEMQVIKAIVKWTPENGPGAQRPYNNASQCR
jgi:hypothetical protein